MAKNLHHFLEDEQYRAYSLLVLWEGDTTEKFDKAAYQQGMKELE